MAESLQCKHFARVYFCKSFRIAIALYTFALLPLAIRNRFYKNKVRLRGLKEYRSFLRYLKISFRFCNSKVAVK